MTRPKHIPWPEKSRAYSAAANHLFALAAHSDEGFHHRSGMRYTEINEMRNAGLPRGFQGHLRRYQIDCAKLRSLRRAGMRHADQMQKRIGTAHLVGIGIHFQRVAHDRPRARRQLVNRALPNESSHLVTALQEERKQSPADVAGAASNKNVMAHCYIQFEEKACVKR